MFDLETLEAFETELHRLEESASAPAPADAEDE